MNKVICHSIEFVFLHEIETAASGVMLLKADRKWKKLEVTEKPVYGSEIKQNDAGPTNEETVSAKTKYDALSPLKKFAAYPAMLRMKTDTETFFVGSLQYPATIEYTTDKVFDTYSFKAVSEA
jgi:hypothetical protein